MSSITDLHEVLGILSADSAGKVHAGGHTYDSRTASALRSLEPIGLPDLSAADRAADLGRDHLATLSPERRERLAREWHEAECDRREALWEASKELAARNGGLV